MKNKLNRREFMASSGLTIAVPWLEFFALPSKAWAASSPGYTSEGYPKRMLNVISCLGTNRDEYVAGTPQNYTFKKIMKPLEKHRDRVTVVKGFEITDEGAGDHTGGEVGVLSGWGVKNKRYANGPSIDQVYLNYLKPDTLVPMVNVSYSNPSRPIKPVSHSASGKAISPVRSPYTVFDILFKDITGVSSSVNSIEQARREVLNNTNEAYKKLKQKVGSEDKYRLDAHIESVAALINKMDKLLADKDEGCLIPEMNRHKGLPSRSAQIVEARPDNLADQRKKVPRDDAVSKTYMDLFAHAFACDLTRVVTFMAGELHSHLNASHKMYYNNRGKNPDAYDSVVESAEVVAGRIAYLVDRLSEFSEGNGSVMDNTIIFWSHTLADGAGHKQWGSRQVLVGNAGGAFKTGKLIEVDQGKEIFHTPVLTTVLQACGVPIEHQGDPRWNRGGLSELPIIS